MDVAKCTLDGDEYSAVKFAKLPPSEIAIKRRHLICIRCSTRAIFVKEARSGQGPHFRARPHVNCALAAPESEQGEGGGEDKDMLRNPGDHIVLDLRYGAAEQVNGDPESGAEGGTRGGRYVGSGGNRRAISRRRLRPILKNLIFSEEFRRSDQTIELPDVNAFRVRDLFVNFSDVTDAHVGRFRGFWGDIQDIRQGRDKEHWINTGDKEDVSVVIGQDICAAFLSYHRVSWSELEGMHFLVFGWLNQGRKNNKLWIRPRGIEFTAIYDGM
ncbi:hypothetical protein ISF08_19050 [Pseudomonas aeruginosa]|uniref:hypothetical protein n=1 Tax=Pseudomonas TaxID=286 RepID=UPI000464CE6C|nr:MULTISPECIES: hypothetical protein [Pseudomonas]KSK78055.2 hypothetical protein APA36_29910 [Pseudomonas aeruginosa]MBG6284360.1 hypothetical protein [Pseudomonas aeruginosa]MBH3728057.1 hypothetical protein [Pseudomonas aeruginosa]MBH3775845.1 hypothetical protein [Pseudomonas aeruginosa]MBI8970362.1 hypothetical protein [Pseudomonas aeruginosa]